MSLAETAHDTPTAAAEACGKRILEVLRASNAARATSSLAVSGGSTPKIMFQWLAAQDFDWSTTHIFWVDERAVGPEDEQSNYRMTRESLLFPAEIPEASIHRVRAELGADAAADLYRQEIKNHFNLQEGELPKFDIIHLGMGPDAHTASLFPGQPLLDDREGIAAAVYVDKLKQGRITLLPGVLLAALNVLILATGVDKAEALSAVQSGTGDVHEFPMQVLTRNRVDLEWFVDRSIVE